MALETVVVDFAVPLRSMEKGGAECMVARRGPVPPPGNRNALKHGRFTRERKAERRRVQELLRQSRKALADIMK